MIRTQIQLTDQQARALREIAAEEGRSMAEIVRDAVSLMLRGRRRLDRGTLKQRSIASLGRFRSGVPDLAVAHDRHLDDVLSP